MIRRLLRTPAVHFAAGGVLLFAVAWRDGGGQAPAERPRLEVGASRLAEARDAFATTHGRAPTATEEAALAGALVDEEVLFRHALALGLAAQPPVERRLAQIASFVAEDPQEALELGLHRDDIVVRRILVDSARRLVRGAVLAREPSEAALANHLRRYPDRFERPEEIRLDYTGKDESEAKELPLLVPRDLERRFGRPFVQALEADRIEEWQGPLPSRLGPIRVLVREHRPARTATLDEARDELREEVRQELADGWLAARVAQLRDEYEVVVADTAPLGEGGAS